MEKLMAKGAEVQYHDPFVPVIPATREHPHLTGKKSVELEDAYDLILLSTDHAEYKNFDFSGLIVFFYEHLFLKYFFIIRCWISNLNSGNFVDVAGWSSNQQYPILLL